IAYGETDEPLRTDPAQTRAGAMAAQVGGRKVSQRRAGITRAPSGDRRPPGKPAERSLQVRRCRTTLVYRFSLQAGAPGEVLRARLRHILADHVDYATQGVAPIEQ